MNLVELLLLIIITLLAWGCLSRIEKLEEKVRTLQVTKKDREGD